MSPKGRKISLYFVIFFCFVFLFSGLSVYEFQKMNKGDETCMNVSGGWIVSYHERTFADVNLNKFMFSGLKRGDVVSLTKILPETSFEYPVMFLFTVYSAVEVYSGGHMIFSARLDRYAQNKQLGFGHDIISLDRLSGDRDIVINLKVAQDKGFSTISPIFLEESGYCITNYLKSKIFPFVSTIFLAVLGILGLTISLTAFSLGRHLFPLLGISLTALAIGIGGLSNGGYIELYTGNHALGSYMEYGSFYTFPLFMMGVVAALISNTSFEKKVLRYFMAAYSVFLGIVVLGELLHLFHVSQTLIFYHIFCAVGLVYVFKVAVTRIKQSELKDSFTAIGLISMFILFLFDLVRNMITTYGLVESSILEFSMLSIGGIIFIVSALWGYFYYMQEPSEEKRWAESWVSGVDFVTGVYNRDRSIQYLKRIAAGTGVDNEYFYAVATFELTGMELLRTKKGTETANEVLLAAAGLLKKVFNCYGQIGRIGPSRFIVIAPGILQEKLKMLVDVFYKYMKKVEERFGFSIKILSAVAFNYELPENSSANPLEVCRLSEMRLRPSIVKMHASLLK
jgi:GGDEF domain-containing protein